MCMYIGVVCVECSLKNGESGRRYFQKIGSLGKVDKQIPPKAERRREQGWDDWDGYGKGMYVIPHYRQASLPNCDLPAMQMNYEASEDSIINSYKVHVCIN